MTYYTEVFSGHKAKVSVFNNLGWWLYLSLSVCFPFTEPGAVYEHQTVFSVHTQHGTNLRYLCILYFLLHYICLTAVVTFHITIFRTHLVQ